MKTSVLLTGLAIIIVLSVLYYNVQKKPTESLTATSTDMMATNTVRTSRMPTDETKTGKIKADTFTGILQKVDIGCFSDGECSVTVDGKHVTLIMGQRQEVVGSIIGAPSIGDLEAFIGKPVEVYAQENNDGTYSLYGSADFHVKILPSTASSTIPSTISGSTTVSTGACVISGCSAQLCVSADSGNTMSTCIYKAEYACYKTATCKRQTSGQCGWTETPTLTACIAKANSPKNNTLNQPQ